MVVVVEGRTTGGRVVAVVAVVDGRRVVGIGGGVTGATVVGGAGTKGHVEVVVSATSESAFPAARALPPSTATGLGSNAMADNTPLARVSAVSEPTRITDRNLRSPPTRTSSASPTTNLSGTVGVMTVASDSEAARQAIVAAHLKPAEERPPSSAGGVHHLALICSDVETTVRFYQEVLGFPLVDVMENRDYPGSTHFFHDMGNGNLLAFFDFPGLGLGPAVETLGAVQHVAISVDRANFEAIRERLDGAGLPYLGPDRGLTNSIYVKDPDGVQIELLAEPLRIMDGRHLG